MSAFFAFAALYRGITFMKKRDWKSAMLCALDIGLSMSCKLGGAIVALALIPMLAVAFIDSLRASKGQTLSLKTPWVQLLLKGVCFALIVFPIGLFGLFIARFVLDKIYSSSLMQRMSGCLSISLFGKLVSFGRTRKVFGPSSFIIFNILNGI